MKLRNIRLTLANVNTTTSRKDMEVVETSLNRVRLEDVTIGRDVESYNLHCVAYKGDILKVKVGKELAGKITKLNDTLNDDVTVLVTFTGLKLKAYALKATDGSIISGVSGRADDFNFEVQDSDDLNLNIDFEL